MGTGAVIRKKATKENRKILTSVKAGVHALGGLGGLPGGASVAGGAGLPALPANEVMGYETEMMIQLSFPVPLPARSDR